MAPGRTNTFTRGNTRFNGGKRGRRPKTVAASSLLSTEATNADEKVERVRQSNAIDETMGFARYDSGPRKEGWLVNMQSTTLEDESVPGGKAGVDFYFLTEEEESFKATVLYDPYFLIATKSGVESEVEEWVKRKFEGLIKKTSRVEKEDLRLPNHLVGLRRGFVKIEFANVQDLLAVRKVVQPIATRNKKNADMVDAYSGALGPMDDDGGTYDFMDAGWEARKPTSVADATDYIVDIREYDVPYHVRVAIDCDIRIGKWYTVEAKHGTVKLSCIEERLKRPDPVVLAFDIETTKLPLKFPDSMIDQIMMISYMIEGQGFLITNREIVSEDIEDFEYTPRPEYVGQFMIFNEPNERALLERFFEHIKEAKPTVIVTYNGDFFDWPFVEARATYLGIDMYQEVGFKKNMEDIYKSTYCCHMDAFSWVKRDSYLPQGSQGLKAVCVAKLGYDPDELDPELMTRYASEQPQTLAQYSVSDAVATYYLYMKYVHPFIFSLCTILPLNPDDVLRKGTGTLCEMLLMVQAYQKNIVLPNKHKPNPENFYDGHLLESETYVGGHVESIEAGVFRSDIPVNFAIDTSAVDELIAQLDDALKFSVVVEGKKKMQDITNYESVRDQIKDRLMQLKEVPQRHEKPSIYHLDVASMYPNIMTTNRLQPDSLIQESDCASCDFNRPGKTCDRRLPWAWRGEYLPAKRDEYNMIRNVLTGERFPPRYPNQPQRTWDDLDEEEQAKKVKARLIDYSKKIYHRIHDSKTIEKEAIICQRENPFYINTVRDFRDRRYDYKGQQKVWKGKTDSLVAAGATPDEVDEAKKMIILFDSLQLAHKVILNSFYGYVMRKGSRWYSMEMAGVTCLTGAHIIQMAKELVERIGRPLELDTDGIWCILPATFPENFAFTMTGGKKFPISYPCVMLNHLVHEKYTNPQYQTLVDPKTFRYETNSENSIFFEVDGPYRAMILPTSKEADKNLKKRYAVFNHDGSLAELKGFEVKRRGELRLIKIFQTQIFKFFLEGKTLKECYAAVAKISDQWLDVLYSKGATLADEELIDLICENRSMSKTLEEYGSQKSTSITTAKRLAEFLGEQMVKDKGLACKFVISAKPKHAPVAERAIPVAIFSADESVKTHFLRKWLKDDPGDMDPRSIIDWDYYLERLGSVIQKLITIPAAYQKVENPVPRIAHPDWLQKRLATKEDKLKQKKITDMFVQRSGPAPMPVDQDSAMADMEDFGQSQQGPKAIVGTAKRLLGKRKAPPDELDTHDPFAALPKVMPDMLKNYKGWLQYQKQKWKIQKAARERRRHLYGDRPNAATNDPIRSFFTNQTELLLRNKWHVLELRPSDSVPGELKVWALIAGRIQTLKIKVPRSFFVNRRSGEELILGDETWNVKLSKHSLPNSHPSPYLWRVEMPEEDFVTEERTLNHLYLDPATEGVYETQVTPTERATMALGTICMVDQNQKGVMGKGKEQGFSLSSLMRARDNKPYLQNIHFDYIFLYHVNAEKSDRQIFAFFSTAKEEAHVITYSTSKEGQPLPNMDRLYNEAIESFTNGANAEWFGSVEYQESLHFNMETVKSEKKLRKSIAEATKKLKSDEARPTMLVIQSPKKLGIISDVPELRDYATLLKTSTDEQSLPLLAWQSVAAKRIIKNYLSIGAWVSRLLDCSRYGEIPLCNLRFNDLRYVIDIAYARKLQDNNVVLWWSPSPKPDHGGYEKDDVFGSMETVEAPVINNPGSYSSVCIEIDVKNLGVNTILASTQINELEGSSFMGPESAASGDQEQHTSHVLSEKAFASAGISVLQELVKEWFGNSRDGNEMADELVYQLVRWVESPVSRLYDRGLQHYVQMMSRKVFLQLLTDFRRVGSNIVYANANRLLVQTTKQDVGNAYAYGQYILTAIKARPIFMCLDLEIKEYWNYIVWYDDLNYGGKGCDEVVEKDEQDLKTIMHWQMKNFLPESLRDVFEEWVSEFIDVMHIQKHQGFAPNGTPRPTQIQHRLNKSNGINGTDGEADEDDVVKATIPKEFSKPLKRQIAALVRQQHDAMLNPRLASKFELPEIPGAFRTLTNPVLQLVKTLTTVFGLAKEINIEARILRKDLLAMLDIKEFSRAGIFENPSESLKFSQVSCPHCTVPRDIDLCRDEDLMPEYDAETGEKRIREWRCQSCNGVIDGLVFQERLIAVVMKIVGEFNCQDLKCGKCKVLKANEFQEHCGCGGQWVLTNEKEGVVRKLKVVEHAASAYGWSMLLDVCTEILGMV